MISAGVSAPWVDGKRYLWLLSPMIPVLVMAALGLYQWTGTGLWAWGGPILLYGIIPLLDWLMGTDPINAPESAVPQLENDPYYRGIVYAYIPTQYIATIWGAWLVVTMDPPLLDLIGLIITVGIVNGIAINTAHELGHKKGAFERWLAKLTLAPGRLWPLLFPREGSRRCGIRQQPAVADGSCRADPDRVLPAPVVPADGSPRGEALQRRTSPRRASTAEARELLKKWMGGKLDDGRSRVVSRRARGKDRVT